MTDPTGQVKALLTDAADDMPGGPIVSPELLAGRTGRSIRDRRVRRAVVAAAAFAVVAAAIAIPVLALHRPAPVGAVPLPGYAVSTVDSYPTNGPGTASRLAKASWHTLPPAPILGREDAAAVWTGQELLVWGGQFSDSQTSDGAAYDPRTGDWRVQPDSGLTGRRDMAYVWTGREFFVWGGRGNGGLLSDGARYDPASDSWRRIPPSPLAARAGATALWTGTQVVVIGGSTGAAASPLDSAAYDPGTDTWHSLPPIPLQPERQAVGVTAVATPSGLYSWVTWETSTTDGDGTTIESNVDPYRYDVSAGQWQHLDDQPPLDLGTPLWTGREIVFPPALVFGSRRGPFQDLLMGWRLDPARGEYVQLPLGPVHANRQTGVWTGAVLLVLDSSVRQSSVGTPAAAVWDPASNGWTAVPQGPLPSYFGAVAVWTGQQLLVWGDQGGASLG